MALLLTGSRQGFFVLFACASTKINPKVILPISVVTVKNIYVKVSKHKNSQSHIDCVKAYIACISRKDLPSILEKEAFSKRQQCVLNKRKVIDRLIDIILYLAKQNAALRSHRSEGAASLEDTEVNHGNFLVLAFEQIRRCPKTSCREGY